MTNQAAGIEMLQGSSQQLLAALQNIFGGDLIEFLAAIRRCATNGEIRFLHDNGDVVLLSLVGGGTIMLTPSLVAILRANGLRDPRALAQQIWEHLTRTRATLATRNTPTVPLGGSYLDASVEDTIRCGRKLLAGV